MSENTNPDSLPSVAIIVLNFNTTELTDALARYLEHDLRYDNKKIYVVDNGSARPCNSATHRLPENLGFTRGMHEGYLIASREHSYDAYWFLNSDIGFEHGNDVLLNLVDVLFSSPLYGQIAPQHNSPHKFMEHAESEAHAVPYLEPTATLIKASTLETVGFWDLSLTHGWGVDYDYGYRVRCAGLSNVLTSRARITHKEHKSISDFPAYVTQASAQMNAILSQKYGENWGRVMAMEPNVVPLILSCDRDIELTRRFVESFHTVRHGLARPIIVIDLSAGPKLSAEYLSLLVSTEPHSVHAHARECGKNFYDSVQDAVHFAFLRALDETKSDDLILFIEDDIIFSKYFLDELRKIRLTQATGLVTLYLPGNEYGSTRVAAEKFYGTQCVLFPRKSLAEITENWDDIKARIPPGYDIRWSRFLAERGYELRCTEFSCVQHLQSTSRLHGHATHVSNRFRG